MKREQICGTQTYSFISIYAQTGNVWSSCRCDTVGVFASVLWLAAAASGKSSASLFPQDAVVRCTITPASQTEAAAVSASKPVGTGCVSGGGEIGSGGSEAQTHHQVSPQNQCEKTDQAPEYRPRVKLLLLICDKYNIAQVSLTSCSTKPDPTKHLSLGLNLYCE